VGTDYVRLSKAINGRVRPSVRVTLALARHFRVDPLWLLDDAREWPPVRLSSAFCDVDAPDVDDDTRARSVLHRCVDLLNGNALLRVVEFVRSVLDQSTATENKSIHDGPAAVSGHALQTG